MTAGQVAAQCVVAPVVASRVACIAQCNVKSCEFVIQQQRVTHIERPLCNITNCDRSIVLAASIDIEQGRRGSVEIFTWLSEFVGENREIRVLCVLEKARPGAARRSCFRFCGVAQIGLGQEPIFPCLRAFWWVLEGLAQG